MDSAHIVIIGMLVVILIVVARMAMNQKDAEERVARAKRVLGSDAAHALLKQLRQPPKESFVYSDNLPAMVGEQIAQQRFLRDYSFPRDTVFARLGTMLETCENESSPSPQCDMFKAWASRMM